MQFFSFFRFTCRDDVAIFRIAKRHTTTRTKHKPNMTILHTITCTKFSPAHNAHEQFTRQLIRNRKLTEKGIERMFAKGCEEYEADAKVCVTRFETAIYCR